MSTFKDYVADVCPGGGDLPPFLPLTHSTLGTHFGKILKNGALSLRECDIFEENLLYFFYGRAAFRALPKNMDSTTQAKPAFYPACILLDIANLPGAVGQLPFDSGAFKKDRLHSELPEEDVNAYALFNEKQCLARFVETFYESNEDYHEARPRDVLLRPSTCEVVSNYHDLLKARSSNSVDDRVTTVELRFNESIPLTTDTVQRLVVPTAWKKGREYLWDAIEKRSLQNKVSFYSATLATSDEHMAALRQKVASVLVEMGLLPNDQELRDELFS